LRRAALGTCDPLPIGIPPIHAQKRRANGARWDWVWDCVALAWPKGGPRATQAWRKGGPSVELNKCFVCNESRKIGVGAARIAGIAVIARHRRDRKSKTSQLHANLGSLGMTEGKCFGILVDWEGGGVGRAKRGYRRHRRNRRDRKPKPQQALGGLAACRAHCAGFLITCRFDDAFKFLLRVPGLLESLQHTAHAKHSVAFSL
jgi:hypothetical protein